MLSRAFRKASATLGSALKLPCIHHSEDSTLGLQKHAPYFLHHRQVAQLSYLQPQSQLHNSVIHGYDLGNGASNNFMPPANVYPPPKYQSSTEEDAASVHDLEAAKRKLRGISNACISYKQLLDLCIDCTENSCEHQGRDIIKSLEQLGDILRIGQAVYIHPQQVARAMENVLPLIVDDSGIEELKVLEKEKAAIDAESQKQVRNEMWCGLGFFSLQTAALLRLTFWEFSWDIIEPLCFYLTSFYFIFGYAFFLNTKMDPTYESFYAARFKTKQRKLMQIRNFNLDRYTRLHSNCRPALEEGDRDFLWKM